MLVFSGLFAVLCSCNRLCDFRKTARITRHRQEWRRQYVPEFVIEHALFNLQEETKKLGRKTWCLFWWQMGAFVYGIFVLILGLAIHFLPIVFAKPRGYVDPLSLFCQVHPQSPTMSHRGKCARGAGPAFPPDRAFGCPGLPRTCGGRVLSASMKSPALSLQQTEGQGQGTRSVPGFLPHREDFRPKANCQLLNPGPTEC
jgi:hypothetical protein